MEDYVGTEYFIQKELGEKLRYDYSANLQVKEIGAYKTSDGVKVKIRLFIASRPETIERIILKDYSVDLGTGTRSIMTIEIRKDIAVDDYFSIHQLKEMNFAIANLVASNLGATTQPVRCGKDDDE